MSLQYLETNYSTPLYSIPRATVSSRVALQNYQAFKAQFMKLGLMATQPSTNVENTGERSKKPL